MTKEIGLKCLMRLPSRNCLIELPGLVNSSLIVNNIPLSTCVNPCWMSCHKKCELILWVFASCPQLLQNFPTSLELQLRQVFVISVFVLRYIHNLAANVQGLAKNW